MEKINNLVLENDDTMLELVRDFLRNSNFEVMIVTTAGRQKMLVDALQKGVVTQLSQPDFGKELECQVTKLFQQIGIPAHVKGYRYLREAVLLTVNNTGILKAMTKELYPEIARRNNTTPSRVERAMRNAIEIAWNRGAVDVLAELFGCSINPERGRPSNSEFIAWVTDRICLEYKNR